MTGVYKAMLSYLINNMFTYVELETYYSCLATQTKKNNSLTLLQNSYCIDI